MRQADRIILNTLSNYGLTFLTIASQLVMIPIVVSHLNHSGFGLANMVLVPYGLFEVLSGTFARALHRYIPQDQLSGDPNRVSRTFTTAMAGYWSMGLIGALLVWLVFDALLSDAKVSAEVMADGRRAMWILIVWLVVGFPLWGYRKGLEAIQRYDLIGISHGVITLARTVLVIVVFRLGYGSVTFFVTSQLLAIVASSLLCRWAMVRAMPSMVVRPRLITGESIALVGTFAAATMIGMLGEVCGSYGFRILVGTGLGMASLGILSAVGTIQQTIGRLIDELTNSFAPAISALEARGSRENVAKLMLTGTKSSMLACSSMCIVPLAAAGPFLHLWLKQITASDVRLLHIMLLVMLPYCLGMTPTYVLFGLGRVKTTGAVLLARGLGGLLFSLAYVLLVKRDLVGATLCMLGVQNSGGVVMLYSACRSVGVGVWSALMEVLVRPMALAGVGAAVTWLVQSQVGDDRWWKLIASVSMGELALFGLIMLIGLHAEERQRILSFAGRLRQRVFGASG